jgi:hypothetical protein
MFFFLSFRTTFAWNTCHSKKNSVRYHKCIQFLPDCNKTVILSFLSDLIEKGFFSTDFRKILRYQISWKSVNLEQSCFICTDRQTGMGMLVVAIRNFGKRLKTHAVLTSTILLPRKRKNCGRLKLNSALYKNWSSGPKENAKKKKKHRHTHTHKKRNLWIFLVLKYNQSCDSINSYNQSLSYFVWFLTLGKHVFASLLPITKRNMTADCTWIQTKQIFIVINFN